MKVIDLTHIIAEDMPMYPGTNAPLLHNAFNHKEHGFMETFISLYSHTGTHIDAPAHVHADGFTLDKYPIEQFVGKALVVNCQGLNKGEKIPLSLIEEKGSMLNEADFILFFTGHSKLWGNPDYFRDFPILSCEAVEWVNQRKLKGIGIDAPSYDPVTVDELETAVDGLYNHRTILKTNHTILLENLCRLGEIGEGIFTLCVLPLNIINADGAPARIIAMLT